MKDLYKKIEALNAIKEDKKEQYAQAQFEIASLYRDKLKDYEKAKYHYQNVFKKDDREFYAKAQFKLGSLFDFRLNNYDEAKRYYQNVLKEDDKKSYANAQLNLAVIYHLKLKDYENAKNHYKNVLKEDDKKIYARAQFDLGSLYHTELNDEEKAKSHYSNAIKEDDKESYAMAQLNLGSFYFYKINDYIKAKIHYSNVLKEDDKKSYAMAQLNLGLLYRYKIKDYKKAEIHYSNILEEDSFSVYQEAQYQLGKIYLIKKKYDLTKKCFKKITFNNINKHCEIQLHLAFIDNKTKIDKELLKKLNSMISSVDQILEYLLVKFNPNSNIHSYEKSFSHYTKPEVLFNFLKEEPSKFRLNLIDFMNDPTENKILFDYFNIETITKNKSIRSFLSSFSFNHNSLNQFRLYGLENNVNGSGVSIVFDEKFFSEKKKNHINYKIITSTSNDNDVNNDIYPLPLYRCVYLEPKLGYIKIAKRNKQSFYHEFLNIKKEKIEEKWKFYIKNLNENKIINIIQKNLEKIKKEKDDAINIIEEKYKFLSITFENLMHLIIMPISCLIKHSAFEDEDECRIVYITDISDTSITHPKDFEMVNKCYLKYSQVGPFINKVYLGPKCRDWNKTWIEKDAENKFNVEPSELPLQ